MDFLQVSRSSGEVYPDKILEHNQRHTCNVVWQLEGRHPLRHVYIKDIVVLLSLVQLSSARADCIDDLAYLLPRAFALRPLVRLASAIHLT